MRGIFKMKKMTKFWRMYIKMRYLFIPDGPDGDIARGNLYRPFLKKCGKCFKVYSQAFIYNPNGLSVGDYVCIAFNAYLGAGAEIFIDDGATVGPFALVSASTRTRKDGSYRTGKIKCEPVYIGKGTQIAGHAVVTAGVSIGNGCLVAAGCVVTESFPDDVLIAGVPGKIIKKVDEKDEKKIYIY